MLSLTLHCMLFISHLVLSQVDLKFPSHVSEGARDLIRKVRLLLGSYHPVSTLCAYCTTVPYISLFMYSPVNVYMHVIKQIFFILPPPQLLRHSPHRRLPLVDVLTHPWIIANADSARLPRRKTTPPRSDSQS